MLSLAILLLIPLIAMRFTNGVNWTLFDFTIALLILLGFGLICEFGIRKMRKIKHLIPVLIFIFIVFLLFWAEFAVGIFGTPLGGN